MIIVGVNNTYDCVLDCFWLWLMYEGSTYVKISHTCQLAGKLSQVAEAPQLCPDTVVGQRFDCEVAQRDVHRVV